MWVWWPGIATLPSVTILSSFCPSQIRFEKDLKRLWKKAGLKQAPEGWQTPKIYVKST